MAQIRITSMPTGEAPEWVRQEGGSCITNHQ